MLGEVALRDARRSGLEHQYLGALLAQNLGHPAAARPRADDDGVIGIGAFVHHPSSLSLEAQHPGIAAGSLRQSAEKIIDARLGGRVDSSAGQFAFR